MKVQTTMEPGLGDSDGVGVEAAAGAASASLRPPRARRRWWPWVLLALAVLALVFTAATAAVLVALLRQVPDGLHVTMHGREVLGQVSSALARLADTLSTAWPWLGSVDWHWSFDDISVGGLTVVLLALAVSLVLAVLSLLTLVPLVVLGVLAGAMVAVLAALLLAAAPVALALSPLWLPVWGLVWWWRRRPGAVQAAHA